MQINSIGADGVMFTYSVLFTGAVFLLMHQPHVCMRCLMKFSSSGETNLLFIMDRVQSQPWCPWSV